MRTCDDGLELVPDDGAYPRGLLDLEHPPSRLYVRGDPTALSLPSLSIIGSRHATPYGLAVSEMAARLAVEAGVAIVSGGAIGCDSAAGRAALAAGGRQVVVLGTGADVVYPRSSAGLIEGAIRSGGAVVSLERWGSPPRRYAFPKRNRVIAALSAATLVAEAGMPSGTFSTAETAADLGRELIAAPGSILSPESRGANYLISIGATCLSDFDSLDSAISRIYGTLRRECASRPDDDGGDAIEQKVLSAVIASPMRLEDLGRAFGMGAVEMMQVVGALVSRGLITSLFDGRFAPTRESLHAKTPLGSQ